MITGTARGRRLKEPVGRDIRPTADQVKEAMFNICQFDVEGGRVLDLFGGTGQLGLEAASRGAAQVVIVDQSREAVALIRENARRTELAVTVRQGDAIGFLGGCGQFDLVFLDPPYASDLAEQALTAIKGFDILSNGGIILCETDIRTTLPELEPPYLKKREYRYGKVKLTLYAKESQSHDDCDLPGQL